MSYNVGLLLLIARVFENLREAYKVKFHVFFYAGNYVMRNKVYERKFINMLSD
jgi:hypothetical protein